MSVLSELMHSYLADHNHNMRFGQWFCTYFLKDDKSVPGLYYESNHGKAKEMVRQWLIENQYIDSLPQRVR